MLTVEAHHPIIPVILARLPYQTDVPAFCCGFSRQISQQSRVIDVIGVEDQKIILQVGAGGAHGVGLAERLLLNGEADREGQVSFCFDVFSDLAFAGADDDDGFFYRDIGSHDLIDHVQQNGFTHDLEHRFWFMNAQRSDAFADTTGENDDFHRKVL